jgi:hypothetical protein
MQELFYWYLPHSFLQNFLQLLELETMLEADATDLSLILG